MGPGGWSSGTRQPGGDGGDTARPARATTVRPLGLLLIVMKREDLDPALRSGAVELVICDHALPGFDPLDALGALLAIASTWIR